MDYFKIDMNMKVVRLSKKDTVDQDLIRMSFLQW